MQIRRQLGLAARRRGREGYVISLAYRHIVPQCAYAYARLADNIHFSTSSSTSQLISVIIPILVIHHPFSLSLQAQNLPFQQILPTVDFFYLLDCLTIPGLDRTYYAHHFISSFTF